MLFAAMQRLLRVKFPTRSTAVVRAVTRYELLEILTVRQAVLKQYQQRSRVDRHHYKYFYREYQKIGEMKSELLKHGERMPEIVERWNKITSKKGKVKATLQPLTKREYWGHGVPPFF